MRALIRPDYIHSSHIDSGHIDPGHIYSDSIDSDSQCTLLHRALRVLTIMLNVMLLVLLSGAGLSFGSARAAGPTDGDVAPRIHNSATPAEGVETITLEELWRIGGDDEESVLIGLIAQALVGDDETIYLLDGQLNQIEVFSADGEHQGTIGREGSGPGEFDVRMWPRQFRVRAQAAVPIGQTHAT